MKNTLRRFSPVAALLIASAAHAQPSPATATNAGPTTSTLNSQRPASPPPSTLSSPPSTINSGAGDRLLAQAASQLERRRSITARLRHQVWINSQQLYGVGSYWQQGTGDDLRVRLELQIAGQETSLLQISNSRFLWFDRLLPTGRTVTRIDLRQLRADPVLAATSFDGLRPGEAAWSSTQTDLTAHCAGLPRLLSALGENFSFLSPQAMRLVDSQATEPANIPFFAVVGHWKPEKLAALVGSRELRAESGEPEGLISVPARLPQEVLLLIGQADLFPYRIEYRGLETPTASPHSQPVTYQLSSRPLVVLELSNIVFDTPIAASQFDYAPRDTNWSDHTAALLERLRQERQAKVAAREIAPSSR